MKKIFNLSLLAFVALHYQIYAQGGAYDVTFNGTGKVITSAAGYSIIGQSSALQADGKIVVAGNSSDILGNNGVSLCRYNTDGSKDISFGTGGVVNTKFPYTIGSYTIYYTFINDVAIQADGKIIVAGFNLIDPNTAFFVARFKANGTVDSTFGTNGRTITDVSSFGSSSMAYGIALQPDGKILLGGGVNTEGMCVVRYKTNGKPDSTFGTNGISKIMFGHLKSYANSIALQSDGKILLAGAAIASGPSQFAVARLDANGDPDETFGTHGRVITDIRSMGDIANAVVVAPSGKVYVGGVSNDALYSDFALAIYNPDGSLYKKTTADINTYGDVANSIGLQNDGQILLAGYADNDTASLLSVARFSPEGILDRFFGASGKVVTDFNSNYQSETGLFVQPDDKIVITGTNYNKDTSSFATARLLRGPALSIKGTVATQGTLLAYPNPVTDKATLTYTLNEGSEVSLQLLDVQGKIIKTYLNKDSQSAGYHEQTISFDNSMSSGNYYIRLTSNSGNSTLLIQK